MVEAIKTETYDTSDDLFDVPKKFTIHKFEEIYRFKDLEIYYFIDNRTLNLFRRFGLKYNFLEKKVEDWDSDTEFKEAKEIFSKLRVVNDCAERIVHLAEQYINGCTKNEKQRQYLIEVVANYRKANPNANKSTLIKKVKV